MRVTQQQDCYTAERVLGDGGVRFADIEAAQRWVDDLRDNRWWHAQGYSLAVLRIEVVLATKRELGRFAAMSHYEPSKNAGLIEFGRDYLDGATALHEIAHIIVSAQNGGPCGHDPRWARTYLTLVSAVLGPAEYVKLRDSFDAVGVDYDAETRATASVFAL